MTPRTACNRTDGWQSQERRLKCQRDVGLAIAVAVAGCDLIDVRDSGDFRGDLRALGRIPDSYAQVRAQPIRPLPPNPATSSPNDLAIATAPSREIFAPRTVLLVGTM